MTFDPPNDDAEYYEIPAPRPRSSTRRRCVVNATAAGCAAAPARPRLGRRFRPNVLVDLGGDAFAEQAWIGGLRCGWATWSCTWRAHRALRHAPAGQPDADQRDPSCSRR
ncbi:MAG: hypothetical protein R2746_04760 [Acidimicrobiales bacterium]